MKILDYFKYINTQKKKYIFINSNYEKFVSSTMFRHFEER
jgi:hypothetical protein